MFLRNLSGIGFNNNTMANISTFQMADVISADKNISVKKGILGLTTKYVYIPTESRIRGYIKEYSMVTGEKLHAILNSPIEQIEDVINCFEESEMGNYRLEMCVSDDKQFVALRLYRFIHLGFEPVTKVIKYNPTQSLSEGRGSANRQTK